MSSIAPVFTNVSSTPEYQERCESHVNTWIKFCCEEYNLDRLDADRHHERIYE